MSTIDAVLQAKLDGVVADGAETRGAAPLRSKKLLESILKGSAVWFRPFALRGCYLCVIYSFML